MTVWDSSFQEFWKCKPPGVEREQKAGVHKPEMDNEQHKVRVAFMFHAISRMIISRKSIAFLL